MNYYWIHIYDYQRGEELREFTENDIWNGFKGTLLDEYYLCGEAMTRDAAKAEVKTRSGVEKFAKPRNGNGIYALIMDSNQFFYERFNIEIDTVCLNCNKPIKGKMKDFPHIIHGDKKYHFCCYACKREVLQEINPYNEGEFQEREGYETNGGVYGYIYHIYNRKTNMHYIGQTVYMPFFRWQEHIKQGLKGNITDLILKPLQRFA